jgi:hypothetical protein
MSSSNVISFESQHRWLHTKIKNAQKKPQAITVLHASAQVSEKTFINLHRMGINNINFWE